GSRRAENDQKGAIDGYPGATSTKVETSSSEHRIQRVGSHSIGPKSIAANDCTQCRTESDHATPVPRGARHEPPGEYPPACVSHPNIDRGGVTTNAKERRF